MKIVNIKARQCIAGLAVRKIGSVQSKMFLVMNDRASSLTVNISRLGGRGGRGGGGRGGGAGGGVLLLPRHNHLELFSPLFSHENEKKTPKRKKDKSLQTQPVKDPLRWIYIPSCSTSNTATTTTSSSSLRSTQRKIAYLVPSRTEILIDKKSNDALRLAETTAISFNGGVVN